MEIQPLSKEGNRESGQTVVVKKKEEIRKGLAALENNEAYHQNHEHFQWGYSVRIKVPGKIYRLFVFYKSNNGSGLSVVRVEGSSATYSAPNFVKWIIEKYQRGIQLTRNGDKR